MRSHLARVIVDNTLVVARPEEEEWSERWTVRWTVKFQIEISPSVELEVRIPTSNCKKVGNIPQAG